MTKELVLQAKDYFGEKNLKITMPFESEITGIIKDTKTGNPLPSKITAKTQSDKKITSNTDSNGKYSLKIPIEPDKTNKVEIFVVPNDKENYSE